MTYTRKLAGYLQVMFKRGGVDILPETMRAKADMLFDNSCLDPTVLFQDNVVLRYNVYKYKITNCVGTRGCR